MNKINLVIYSFILVVFLSSCNSMLERLQRIGEEPEIRPIENPTKKAGYKPVTMPMPTPISVPNEKNSLWRSGSRSFFKDQRAGQIGDIVSVIINTSDKADLSNTSSRSRASSEDLGVSSLFGFEAKLGKILPSAVDNNNLVDFNNDSASRGDGSIKREEKIELKISAVITQVLPNGNMVLHGQQSTRVNSEVRELQIAGIIRPQDITNQNTITYDKIAEARIVYGGKGLISDVQKTSLWARVC